MNTQRGIFDFHRSLDHLALMEHLNTMSERYPFLGITSIGESIMGRMLPLITLGSGEKAVLYVGTHGGTEWSTALFLLRFLNELCELYQNEGSAFRYSVKYLLATRTLYFVPMLNPDGVDYHIHGVPEDHVLYERLQSMNGGQDDFRTWQANARGVDLRHNYPYGFSEYRAQAISHGIDGGAPRGYCGEMPESEPEVGMLPGWARMPEYPVCAG